LADWAVMRLEILEAVRGYKNLCSVDNEAVTELKKFYHIPQFGFEHDGRQGRIVAISQPSQENTSFQLFAALEKLHPIVKRFVTNIVDGATVREAADECGLADRELAKILPPLKVFLKPLLIGAQ
jgi:hypothetical protein